MITETDRLKMVIKLEEIEHKNSRINELVQKGFMSPRFGKYAGQLTMIEFTTEEAEMYAKYRDIEQVGKNLAEAKRMIDTIAGFYLQPLFEKNPKAFFRREFGEHGELIDYALQKFDKSINECERILEVTA